jgi:SAM-dependent methyltransferase
MTKESHKPTSWTAYLTAFHQDRPGITEDILGASRSAGQNPYEWLLEVITGDETLLDVACGSAPLLQAGWKSPWIGVDRSQAELARARAKGAGNLVNAEARHLPFGNRQFTAVACSMALMLLVPLDECLAEIARVLAPGGTLALLLPGGPWSLHPIDIYRWSNLLRALRRVRLRYPNDRLIGRLEATATRHGLHIVTDDRRRFDYGFTTAIAADCFVDSLYLPDTMTARTHDARLVARRWVGSSIGIPLRRVGLCLTTLA